MSTITSTGSFMARPNAYANIGEGCEYHWHNFKHTVIPYDGLWRVTTYPYVEGIALDVVNDTPIDSIFIGHSLFTPPELVGQVAMWAMIDIDLWHRIELVSKTAYGKEGATMEVDLAHFLCCWSYRMPDGTVVEYDTGWEGQVG